MTKVHSFYEEIGGGADAGYYKWETIGLVEPLMKAHISGLPEDCYPAEGGYASLEIAFCRELGLALDRQEALSRFGTQEVEQLEKDLYQAWQDESQALYEETLESRASARDDI